MNDVRRLYYAAGWETGHTNQDLKQSMAALKGFKAATREKVGAPNVFEVVLLLPRAAAEKGTRKSLAITFLTLLQFDTLARPGEMCVMEATWCTSTRCRGGKSYRCASSPAIATVETRPSSRTTQYWLAMSSSSLGQPPPLLVEIARLVPHGPLLKMSLAEYGKELGLPVNEAKLARTGMVPHGNRHCGASLMALIRGRTSSTRSEMVEVVLAFSLDECCGDGRSTPQHGPEQKMYRLTVPPSRLGAAKLRKVDQKLVV